MSHKQSFKRQNNLICVPTTHFKARARKAIRDRYYEREEPPMCLPHSQDHPLYYRKNNLLNGEPTPESLSEYEQSVRSFLENWVKKSKKLECLYVMLRQLYFMEQNDGLEKVASLLKDIIISSFTEVHFGEFICELEGTGISVSAMLPTDKPVQLLEELFLCIRNTNVKEYTWKSTKQMTILVEYQDSEEETIVVNSDTRTISEIQLVHPKNEIRFYLKKEFAIKRRVYFSGGFKATINQLSAKVSHEYWGAKNCMLQNFVNRTVVRQLEENHVLLYDPSAFDTEGDCKQRNLYACHLNLVNKGLNPIIMVLERYDENLFPYPPEYCFVKFHDISQSKVELVKQKLPKPLWVPNPADLLFDPKLNIECNFQHVLKTNEPRIKKCFGRLASRIPGFTIPSASEISEWFKSQLKIQGGYASECWMRFAVPQVFNEEIQLLLPLYRDKIVVMAITLRKEPSNQDSEGFCYRVNTILEPLWAYNNARVLGPIESSWLSTVMKDAEYYDALDDEVLSDSGSEL